MACRFAEERKSTDWVKRREQLRKIVDWARKNAYGGFDCVVGVSGGKDSHFQSLYARDQLGLKALLVNCAPDFITEVGRQNLENLVQHGFDMISFRPNPKVMRAVTRRAFFEHGNLIKPSEYPLYAVSYQTALKFNIPLIIQGENPAVTLGTVGFLDTSDDAWGIRSNNTLDGGNASDWVQKGIGLKDLLFYQFPKHSGTRAIYLGHFAEEWSYYGNTVFAIAKGLKGRPRHDPYLMGRLSPYSVVDSDFQIVNQMLKYYKFGFGFVTDEVCYNIREGRLPRKEALQLVEAYDGRCDERYIHEFCEYIGITTEMFWQAVDVLVNKKLFQKNSLTKEWEPTFR